MRCCTPYKLTSLLLSLLLMAAPAFGHATMRCEDGSPCPMVQRPVVMPAGHACCKAPVAPVCPHHVAPAPPQCHIDSVVPPALDAERKGSRLPAPSLVAFLPASDTDLHPQLAGPAVRPATESPPQDLAPEQGRSPRAPPSL